MSYGADLFFQNAQNFMWISKMQKNFEKLFLALKIMVFELVIIIVIIIIIIIIIFSLFHVDEYKNLQ